MRAWFFSSLVLLLAFGCSMESPDRSAPGASGSGGTSSGGDTSSGGEAEPVPASLKFEAVDPLVPRQDVVLRVRAKPAGSYHVRFTLPSAEADQSPLDAVLTATTSDTDADNIASVHLIAPSEPTTFVVRADVDNVVQDKLTITVMDTGYASVTVEPRYRSALRYPTTWVATAHPGKTCVDLPGIPPPDGSVISQPAGQNEAPLLPKVPANTPLAITLRSGHFVGGCASVSPLAPDSMQVVTVPVLNRPIDLSASDLSLKLELMPPDAAWTTLLASAQKAALSALIGTSIDDVDAVLDAMREAAGNDRQAFESARKAEGWDALLSARYGNAAPHQIHDLVDGWLSQAQKSFATQTQLLQGAIEPDGAGDSSAHLNVESVAGLTATQAGFASPALWSWSAGPDDNITMGTDLYLFESKLLTSLGETVAVASAQDATDAPGALVEALDCQGASAALAAAGPSPTLAYAGCDASCLESLCEQGLRAMWQRAANATGLSPSRLTLTATGHAFVGESAEVAGMTGSWLGELSSQGQDATTSGALTATSPP
jgi:hypothetical protein